MRAARLLLGPGLLAALAMLAACGEKPQTNAQGVKMDAAPWSGSGPQADGRTAFTAPGYVPGDRRTWQEQLRVRTQTVQNEYNKEN